MADEIRYGVIGSGMMGLEHMLNIAAIDDARVVAIADPHEPSQRAAQQVAGDDVAVFDDHRDLLESGLCDAVVIATPNMTHHEVLVDTLRTGVHTLIEKPLCTTVEACREVVELAEGHPGVVWMGLEYRYMPPIARLLEEVAAGASGTVKMVAIREHRFPFLPKVAAWNRFSANTGGTLVEKCVHFFHLMNVIAGATPVRVMASGAQDVNHLDETYDGRIPDIIDNAYVIVEYDSGVRAMLDLCMFAEGSKNEQEIVVTGDIGKVEAFVPEGVVRIGRREDGPAMREEFVDHTRPVYEGLHHGSSFLEHLDFLAAIRNGSAPLVTVAEGMSAVAVGVAAHLSIDEQRSVDMTEVV